MICQRAEFKGLLYGSAHETMYIIELENVFPCLPTSGALGQCRKANVPCVSPMHP